MVRKWNHSTVYRVTQTPNYAQYEFGIIVKRIEGYKNTSGKTPVITVIVNDKKTLIRSSTI